MTIELRKRWSCLSDDTKFSVAVQGAMALFTVLALVLSIVGVIKASSAAGEANRNQIEYNQLAGADKVSWYFGRADPSQPAGNGQLQLRIENHGLTPAVNVLLLDPGRDWNYHWIYTLPPCTRYLVNIPLAVPGLDYSANAENFQFQFKSAGKSYHMEHDRKVVELLGGEVGKAESTFTEYTTKGPDVAHKLDFYHDYKDLTGCG